MTAGTITAAATITAAVIIITDLPFLYRPVTHLPPSGGTCATDVTPTIVPAAVATTTFLHGRAAAYVAIATTDAPAAAAAAAREQRSVLPRVIHLFLHVPRDRILPSAGAAAAPVEWPSSLRTRNARNSRRRRAPPPRRPRQGSRQRGDHPPGSEGFLVLLLSRRRRRGFPPRLAPCRRCRRRGRVDRSGPVEHRAEKVPVRVRRRRGGGCAAGAASDDAAAPSRGEEIGDFDAELLLQLVLGQVLLRSLDIIPAGVADANVVVYLAPGVVFRRGVGLFVVPHHPLLDIRQDFDGGTEEYVALCVRRVNLCFHFSRGDLFPRAARASRERARVGPCSPILPDRLGGGKRT